MALAIYGFVARKKQIEHAGISYEYLVIKDKLALGLPTHPVLRIVEAQQAADEADLDEGTDWMDPDDAKYKKYIGRLDPNDAKEQDHYKVLGLSKLRYQATPAQIKTAYRQKVLIYHPDKGKASEGELRTESVFACIQKAYEQVGISEEKRRAFDSVDPKFDESTPDSVEPEEFFRVLGPVFERNARFSINQPVPLLGDENSDRMHVEHFYEFWFDWKSWREFSYLDAEDKTKGEDRWERREIEKQNKVFSYFIFKFHFQAEREKRRKRDLRRISALVELAYVKDPRIGRFKEEDRRRKAELKEQKRREKQAKEQAELEEQKRREQEIEEERLKREEEGKREAKAKQQKKKVLAAQRKRLRDLASAANYWMADGQDQQRVLGVMEQIERICLSAEFEELSAVCEKLKDLSEFDQAFSVLRECCRKETTAPTNDAAKNGATAKDNNRPSGMWAPAELQLLIKAVNLYPPGTQERWKQVAEYVSYHGGEQRTEKDVIKQVKLLKSDPASNSAPATQLKAAKADEVTGSGGKSIQVSTTAAAGKCPDSTTASNAAVPAGDDDWSAEQQRQLEKALRDTKAADPDRWDKIAAAVEGKNKKQCVRRYKRLAELVKQSKEAK